MAASSVAILQNQFRVSGRSRVVCEIIALLNELGITPDVLTFTPVDIGRQVGGFLGWEDLRLNYKRIAPVPMARGWLWQIVAINLMTRSQHRNYDLVVNSNNTLYGLDPNATYLHYVHFPLALGGRGLDHFQEFRGFNARSVYGYTLARILQWTSKASACKAIYANSEFTRDAIFQVYPESRGNVSVIFPPSFDGTVNANPKRARRCITVGSIAPDKNQLQQLAIARQVPEVEFWIIGAVKSKAYYRMCLDYIARAKLDNVRLIPDASRRELQDALNQAMFFLHTKIDEHFGISTVEAIASGCIPVVHNSGGQREIVPLEALRFDTPDQAVAILHNLLAESPSKQGESRHFLQQHLQKFSQEAFRRDMREALLKQLP